ncbi:MAG: FeoC-like transcriptional regulator [Propionibacteriaceae bacterium]
MTPTRPLHAILAAFDQGALSLADVAERTHLSDDVVRAGVDHLVRLGRLDAKEISNACPSGGCRSCGSTTESSCSRSIAVTGRTSSTLVALSLRRPRS